MAAPTVASFSSQSQIHITTEDQSVIESVTRHVMFTVPLLRSRPPYCLRRHTLLLRGCPATVVNKRHIPYSMHVTVFTVYDLPKSELFVMTQQYIYIIVNYIFNLICRYSV
jgi:hypothetical protein